MNAKGATNLAVAPERLWQVLGDPERLACALDQITDFEPVDGDQDAFTATIRPVTALGVVPFATRWRRVRSTAPSHVSYEVGGRGDEQLLELSVELRLDSVGDGTKASWDISFSLTGTMRSVGQRVLPAVVNHQVEIALARAADSLG